MGLWFIWPLHLMSTKSPRDVLRMLGGGLAACLSRAGAEKQHVPAGAFPLVREFHGPFSCLGIVQLHQAD